MKLLFRSTELVPFAHPVSIATSRHDHRIPPFACRSTNEYWSKTLWPGGPATYVRPRCPLRTIPDSLICSSQSTNSNCEASKPRAQLYVRDDACRTSPAATKIIFTQAIYLEPTCDRPLHCRQQGGCGSGSGNGKLTSLCGITSFTN
jgi:hypothetical protein